MPSQYFLDRSLGGKKVATALRAAGWNLVTMTERYGRSVSEKLDDVSWIAEMTAEGFALLTADSRIVRNPLEIEAINVAHAVVFIIPSGDLTAELMAARFIRHERAIESRAAIGGPAAFVLYERTLSRVLP